jgi:hypothetical protein
MHRTGFDIDRLYGCDARHRGCDLLRCKAPPLCNDRRPPHSLGDRLDTADAAPGRTRNVPPPLVDEFGVGRGEPHPEFDTILKFDDVERDNLLRELHDSFAKAEAYSEVAQIFRRSHHHGVSAAIVRQRDRRLLRDEARAVVEVAVAPDLTTD